MKGSSSWACNRHSKPMGSKQQGTFSMVLAMNQCGACYESMWCAIELTQGIGSSASRPMATSRAENFRFNRLAISPAQAQAAELLRGWGSVENCFQVPKANRVNSC